MHSQCNQKNLLRKLFIGLITASLAACGGSGSTSSTAGAGGTGTTSVASSTGGTGGGTGGSGASNAPPPCLASATVNKLTLSPGSCPSGTQGKAYAGCTIMASGGTPPYSYCVSTTGQNPPLPEGITINGTTGAISATQISGQGYYGSRLVATDSAGNTGTLVIGFSINGSNAYLSTIFPSSSIFHHQVDALSTSLPVDVSPAAAISSADRTAHISAGFGNQFSSPWPYGTPTIQVPANQAIVPVTTPFKNYFTAAPIPADAPIQGTSYAAADRHVIVYRAAGGSTPPALYEMYQGAYVIGSSTGAWTDAGNALWPDVTSNALTPQGFGTTNAAGLPDGPLLINADEVIGTGTAAAPNGAIRHTIRFTVSRMLDNWVWPATATAGTGSCTGIPTYTLLSQSLPPSKCSATSPAGQIYRLNASTTVPTCMRSSPQAAIIITALRNYGMIVGDNSFPGQLVGTPDARWNDQDLACLNSLTLADFEPVNVSSLMVGINSGATSH